MLSTVSHFWEKIEFLFGENNSKSKDKQILRKDAKNHNIDSHCHDLSVKDVLKNKILFLNFLVRQFQFFVISGERPLNVKSMLWCIIFNVLKKWAI